ncbi:MAG TPA: PAS domain-containing sensor histidine kinase [Nocardioidaceae bacterium]|nr:PAS domain-containing sensor histidine kinase [Nocardioidaceae bacterium]
MTTELRLLENALHATESFFRILVFQVVDYAIVGLDADGRVMSWNIGAERLDGYRADEAIGKHISMFYGEDDTADGLPQHLLDQARKLGHVEHAGWRKRKDGSEFWGDVVVTPLRDEEAGLIGFAMVTRDLTEQRRLEAARDTLFASISHDLKTPLTSIQGFASMIGTADPARQADMAARIQNNAQRLSELIDTLVTHARMRAGVVGLALEDLSAAAATRECIANLGQVLVGHEVVVESSDVLVRADRSALERILGNLLTNAAKYSAHGTPIEVTFSSAHGLGHIVVRDRGRGIQADDLPVIFDEFERGQLAEPDGGTGLGLSSVRQLVTLHGGHVSISSAVGKGTAVTVQLPLARTGGAV